MQADATLTRVSAEFEAKTQDGRVKTDIIELKGSSATNKSFELLFAGESPIEWTDELEDERITLIETEEERNLNSDEATRLKQLMKWSSESRDKGDEEAFQRRLDGLDKVLADLKMLKQEAAEAVKAKP